MNALRRATRVALSAGGLAAAVGAVPALLVGLVGNPLPSRLPTWAETQTALADGWKPSDRFVIGMLSVLLWVLWARLMGHLFAEVRAHQAGLGTAISSPVAAATAHPARRGLSRRVAGWLVGGLMAAGPLLPSSAFAAPAPLPAVLVATHATAGPGAPGPVAGVTPPGPVDAQAASPPSPEYVVHTWAESKDCLWNIAERYLGDPIRWHEIEDLNEDVAQPSGRRLGDDPRHWVYAGMVLRLPVDATGPGLSATPAAATSTAADPLPAAPAAATPAPPVVTKSGAGTDVPPAAATTPAPPMSVAPTPAAAPPASVRPATTWPPPTAPQRPPAGLAAPGSRIVVPPSSVPPAPPEAQGRPEGAVRAAPTVEKASRSGATPAVPFLGVGGLVVAAGVAAEVRRRRRRQLARRRPDERLPELSGSAAAAARAVAYSPLEDVDWLSAELLLLVRQLGAAARSRFEASVVQYHGQSTIEIGLSRSCGTPPAGWAGAPGSTVWTLSLIHI